MAKSLFIILPHCSERLIIYCATSRLPVDLWYRPAGFAGLSEIQSHNPGMWAHSQGAQIMSQLVYSQNGTWHTKIMALNHPHSGQTQYTLPPRRGRVAAWALNPWRSFCSYNSLDKLCALFSKGSGIVLHSIQMQFVSGFTKGEVLPGCNPLS